MTVDQFRAALGDIQNRVSERFDRAYQEWLKHTVTLSTGALTLLVSLRSTYAAANPRAEWLLAGCWCCLCVATQLGLWALYGEARAHQEFREGGVRRAQEALRMGLPPAEILEAISKQPYGRPRRFVVAAISAGWSLGLALTSLTAYAVVNLFR